jgi:hypothetical protein
MVKGKLPHLQKIKMGIKFGLWFREVEHFAS